MNCPSCQHPNAENARFCTQCGASLVPAVPPATPSRNGNRAVLVVLGVVVAIVLMVGVAVFGAAHFVAKKVRAMAEGDAQESSQPGTTDRSADPAGNAIGSVLGTDAKGKSDIAHAIAGLEQTGGDIEQHDAARGNADRTPDADDMQHSLGAVGGLLGAIGHSLGGSTRHDPVDFHALEALLPQALPGMQRATPRGSAEQALGIATTSAQVDFHGAGDASIDVSIKDATAISALASIAGMANNKESQAGDSYERNETIGGQRVHETWDAASRQGTLSLIVAKRFGVDIAGSGVDMDALKAALASVDIRRLEAMQDANRKAP